MADQGELNTSVSGAEHPDPDFNLIAQETIARVLNTDELAAVVLAEQLRQVWTAGRLAAGPVKDT